MLEVGADLLATWLDEQDGASGTDHDIFRQHAAFYEAEFLADMAELNVRPPDVLTRVSEYVPKIEAFVAELIKKGNLLETHFFHFSDLKVGKT